jgi:FkbM family methyltransferase
MNILDRFAEIVSVPHPVVVELGAHDGTHTEQMVDRLTQPFTFIAVEPDAGILPRLQARQLRIKIVPAAIGSRDFDATIFYQSTKPGCGSIRRATGLLSKFPDCTFTETTVPAVTLDTICGGLDRIDFIWADIQGAELDMIEGGREALARTRYLYTEHEAGMYEGCVGLTEILARLPGWELVEDYGYDALLRNGRLVKHVVQ